MHAEGNVIEMAGDFKKEGSALYITYSPCVRRSDPDNISCCDRILEAGIETVVYAAVDSNFGRRETDEYLSSINVRQIDDPELIYLCGKVFKESCKKN